MRYLDSNIFLYPVLYEGEKAAASKRVLLKVARGEIQASTSVLTWDEFVWVVRKTLGLPDSREEGAKLLRFPNLLFLDVTPLIVFRAQELSEETGIKPRDALHAASALHHGIREFVSYDPDFDAIPSLERIPPENV